MGARRPAWLRSTKPDRAKDVAAASEHLSVDSICPIRVNESGDRARVRPPVSLNPRSIFVKTFVSMLQDDAGQGLVEYAIIIALVSVVAVVTLRILGQRANNALSSASNSFS
jgi:Flp pilus assembly pilin Flp